MLGSRHEREALGFTMDTCIALKVPPCRVNLTSSFEALLIYLGKLRARKKAVDVFDEQAEVIVSVGFLDNMYNGFRQNSRFLQTWMIVCTKQRIEVRDSKSLAQLSFPGGEMRTYYMDPFEGTLRFSEVVKHEWTEASPAFTDTVMRGDWHFMIRPAGGSECAVLK